MVGVIGFPVRAFPKGDLEMGSVGRDLIKPAMIRIIDLGDPAHGTVRIFPIFADWQWYRGDRFVRNGFNRILERVKYRGTRKNTQKLFCLRIKILSAEFEMIDAELP